ncbi:MAG: ATP-dependent Clp protease proteolytic subunit [Oscillospiraceae bacterium]|jgi:ATP-dependent protease ClpP protease subunit|nr:ATP-dependent Clp protease proteolytic subunit [Oscillospiraceae bacterium]
MTGKNGKIGKPGKAGGNIADGEFTLPELMPEPEPGQAGQEGEIRERRAGADLGSVTVEGRGGLIHCLTVIGQIEGHVELPAETKTTKYEHVIPQLVAIEESREVRGLLIILNTVGGDIEAGLALAELIAGMKKPTVSLVLGGGHSIGVPLAVSANRSFITPSATMTIHPVRMNGVILGVPQTLSYFQQMQERIVRFVAANSRIAPDRYRQLMLETGELVMDFGTVLTGDMAVREGLIDELGGLARALDCLYGMIPQDAQEEMDGTEGE